MPKKQQRVLGHINDEAEIRIAFYTFCRSVFPADDAGRRVAPRYGGQCGKEVIL